MKYWTFYIFFQFLIAQICCAQHFPKTHNILNFDRLSYSKKTPFVPANVITQDQLGFIWFGTNWGLYRYDGYQSDRINVIVHEQITCLFEDKQMNLWVGTANGLTRLDSFREQTIHYQVQNTDDNTLNYVHTIQQDQNGSTWVGMNAGLYRIEPQSINLQPVTLFEDNLLTNLNIPITSICIDNDEVIWLSCIVDEDRTVLISYNPKTGETESFSKNEMQFNETSLKWFANSTTNQNLPTFINKIIKDKNGLLWLGPWDGDLTSFHPITKQIKSFPIYYDNSDTRIPVNATDLFEDEHQWLWIASKHFGLIRFHIPTQRRFFENDFYRAKGLSDELIHTLFQEKTGSVWISTELSINRFDPYPANFQSIQFIWDARVFPSVRDLIEDKNGTIWAGTSNGLHYFNPNYNESEFFKDIGNQREIKASHSYSALAVDNDGIIWAGRQSGGVQRFNPQSNELTEFDLFPNVEVSHKGHIRDIAIDLDGNIWFTTHYSGLVIYHSSSGTFEYSYPKLPSTTSLLVDSKGTVWIGTSDDGLYCYQKDLNSYHHFPYTNDVYSNGNQELIGNTVWDIVEDAYGNIWIGTNQGLNQLNGNTDSFHYWSRNEGFAGVGVKSILIADDGKLWLDAEQYGITSYDPNTNNFNNYRRLNATNRIEFSPHSALKHSNGKLYFSSTGSVTTIDQFAQSNKVNPHEPNVTIREVKLLGEPVPLLNRFTPNAYTFDYWQNSLSIEYTILHFSNPSENQSKYRLIKGSEPQPEWNISDGNNIVRYESLSSGAYLFEVKGANHDGVWNQEPYWFTFHIKPPFWETLLFKISMCFCLITFVVLFIQWRVYRIRQKNTQLETEIHHRTLQLASERDYSHQLIEYSPTIILGFDSGGRVTFINPAACSIFGLDSELAIGHIWYCLLPLQQEQDAVRKMQEDSEWKEDEQYELSLTFQTGKTHRIMWKFIHHYNEAGGIKEVVAFGNDITERIEKEIIEISHREQQKIGQEIHDSLCQRLTGIGLMCESLTKIEEHTTQLEKKLVLDIRRQIKTVTNQSYNLARGLYLSNLEHQNFAQAIRELTINFQELFSIPCKFFNETPFEIENINTASHLYRIIQEALSNALKYSKAEKINVSLSSNDLNYLVRITDNGTGFDTHKTNQTGMGLKIMQFRARMINAHLNIESQTGKGTTVSCTVAKGKRKAIYNEGTTDKRTIN